MGEADLAGWAGDQRKGLRERRVGLAGRGVACVLRACVVGFVVGVWLGGASSALAVQGHSFERSFGSCPEAQRSRGECGEAGQLELLAPIRRVEGLPGFRVAGSGVAVDGATGDVYVADGGNHRVDEFEGDGAFVGAFGANVGGAGVDTCTSGCKAGSGGSAPGELQAPRFVAVDNSSRASRGDVYVATGFGSEAVDEYDFLEVDATHGEKGTYKLTFEGETTAAIDYEDERKGPEVGENDGEDATLAQHALEDLPAIGTGNVEVRERADEEDVLQGLQIEFVGALAERALPPVTVSEFDVPGATARVLVEREGSQFEGEIVSKYSASGVLLESWGVNGQLTGLAASGGPFQGALSGIAVDGSGGLWVFDAGLMYEFDEDAKAKEPTLVLGAGSASGIAVDDSGELYVVDVNDHDCIERVGHGCVNASHDPDPSGFGLDLASSPLEVYADLGESVEDAVSRVSPAPVFGSPKAAGGELEGGAGVAVDSSTGTVYVADTAKDRVDAFGVSMEAFTRAASEVNATTAVLNGEVNPRGTNVVRCVFQYGETTSYSATVPCLNENDEPVDEDHPVTGGALVKVHADVEGLTGGRVYDFVLHVVNEHKESLFAEDETLETLKTAVVEGPATVDVEATSVLLTARVNPEGVDETSCTIEWGASSEPYEHVGVACEPASLGSGTAATPVSLGLSGLTGGTTYHWRVVVKDKDGTVESPDNTFVYLPVAGVPPEIEGCAAGEDALRGESNPDPQTQLAFSATLPDCRAYEMVTPTHKNATLIEGVEFGLPTEFASEGSRVFAGPVGCFAGAVSCTGSRTNLGAPFEFARTSGGWVTRSLGPPASVYSNIATLGYSPDTDMALFSAPVTGRPSDELYAGEPDGELQPIGPVAENLPFEASGISGAIDVLATSDVSHVLYRIEEYVPWPGLLDYTGGLYEYAGTGHSEPLLVNVNDSDQPLACGAQIGSRGGKANEYSLSSDGSEVYFTCGEGLYVRVDGEEPGHAETVMASARAAGSGGEPYECDRASECEDSPQAAAFFEGASEDGSQAFFTSTQQLTNDASEDDHPGDERLQSGMREHGRRERL